ncbi:MAG TPA: DUF2442 domain-containing protein [Chloroflexota bacterium]|jgi:hypothetical protein
MPGNAFTIASPPRASGVRFAETMVYFQLSDGREIGMPLEWSDRLSHATPQQRANWRLIGSGIGVHWPDVDEDISVPVLLGQDCL